MTIQYFISGLQDNPFHSLTVLRLGARRTPAPGDVAIPAANPYRV